MSGPVFGGEAGLLGTLFAVPAVALFGRLTGTALAEWKVQTDAARPALANDGEQDPPSEVRAPMTSGPLSP